MIGRMRNKGGDNEVVLKCFSRLTKNSTGGIK